ncbi:MAG: cobalt ECF transporter T component CbiQ [Anaerolineae bacterium]|jgi:cobalt/nickel transport system permease protein|nr:cobalt ECF transporter T component CbiQ [Anaerolineae bacterium]MBT7069834.1 cobalt ECF transporter T component CbiQ [Anaerolineae bacterium]MBT7325778.1 cobalt ECF transporter T component CbiQ [Anaerolineae bacterium]
MHDSLFDRFREGESFLHRLAPTVKVVITVLFILSDALLPDGHWLGFGISWLTILLLNLAAQLGWSYTLKRSFIAFPFALAAITAIFALPGETLAVWDFGPWHLIATDAGLLRFLSIVVRSWLSVQVAILLVTTTQFPDLIHALEHLRLPRMLVTVIAFLYRYIFVLSDEVLRLLRARQARSAIPPHQRGGGSILWRARIAGNMVGQLFLRSYERSDRIYNAMLARGYQGHLRTLNRHGIHTRDWLLMTFAIFLLILLQLFAHLG